MLVRLLHVGVAFTLVKITREVAKPRNVNPALISHLAGIHLSTSELKHANGAVVRHWNFAHSMGLLFTPVKNTNSVST